MDGHGRSYTVSNVCKNGNGMVMVTLKNQKKYYIHLKAERKTVMVRSWMLMVKAKKVGKRNDMNKNNSFLSLVFYLHLSTIHTKTRNISL